MNLLIFLLLQTPVPVNGGEQAAPVGGAVLESTNVLFRTISGALPYIGAAILVLVVFRIIARFAESGVKALILRTRFDKTLAALLGGITSVIVTFLGVTLAVLILFPGFDPLQVIAGLSALTVALGFIFKDLSENFYSGVVILWRKPYDIGDQITIGEYTGVVEGLTFRATLIKTLSNERAYIPNSHIMAGELLVKTAFKTRRLQLVVRIGLSDDIETARETIQRAVLETEGVVAAEEKPIVAISDFGESSINFTVYFRAASDPISGILVTDRVATNIKYALDKAGFKIPYEHTVVHLQDSQEKTNDGGNRGASAERRRAIRSDAKKIPADFTDRDSK